MSTELIDCVAKMSPPRPWLVNNHEEAYVSGIESAPIVNAAKMTAACSQLGPNTTRVSGLASASDKPAPMKAIKATAS